MYKNQTKQTGKKKQKQTHFKMLQFIGGKMKGLGALKGVEELLVG